MLAVRCEHTVKTGEVDACLGHQGGEPDDEVQGLENDMRGAISIVLLALRNQRDYL